MYKQIIILTAVILFFLNCSENNIPKENIIIDEEKISFCGCETNKLYDEILSCDTISFSNNSILYWKWDCDSSWLTFENIDNEKIILNMMDKELIPLSERIGMQFIKEYNSYLLFNNYMVSGCCDYPGCVFLDKNSGERIKQIESFYNISLDAHLDYLIYFSDTNFTEIKITILSEKETYQVKFPKNLVNKSLQNGKIMYPYQMFDIEKKQSIIKIKYKYSDDKENWKKDSIIFDYKKNLPHLIK